MGEGKPVGRGGACGGAERKAAGNPGVRWCRPDTVAVLLLGGVLAVRICYLLVFPFGLSMDEAYYWDWGRRLAWGYYSKPPVIGWLFALGEALGGSERVLRSLAALFGVGALGFLYLLGRSIFSPRTGLWALLLFLAMPGLGALHLLLTIDAPTFFFWSAGLYGTWRYLQARRASLAGGLVVALVLGLGHLTKQILWVFPLLALAVAVAVPAWRSRLRREARWWPLAASYLLLLPNLAWNAVHGWPMFGHLLGYVDGAGSVLRLHYLAELVASELFLVGPLLLVLLVAVLVRAGIVVRRLPVGPIFLWGLSAPGILGYFLFALTERVLPNWPLVFVASGTVLVAGMAREGLAVAGAGRRLWWGRRWLAPTVVTGLGLAALLLLSPFLAVPRVVEATGIDPFRRLRGWEEYAAWASGWWREWGGASVVVDGHRSHVSALAYYGEGQPRVRQWQRGRQPASQYHLGPEETEPAESLLVVVGEDREPPAAFASHRRVDSRVLSLPDGTVRHYTLLAPPGTRP